jgi:hypothetical protein
MQQLVGKLPTISIASKSFKKSMKFIAFIVVCPKSQKLISVNNVLKGLKIFHLLMEMDLIFYPLMKAM